MTERQTSAPTRHERMTQVDPSGSVEELALAALQRQLEAAEQSHEDILPIQGDEICTLDLQKLTLNSRHSAEFFKTRFSYAQRTDLNGRRVFAFPREQVEPYVARYHDAQPLPTDYQGRSVRSFITDALPEAVVFGQVNELELEIQIYILPNGQRGEFLNASDTELLELGLAEVAIEASSDAWQPLSPYEQLEDMGMPERSVRPFASDEDSWIDRSISVVPSKAFQALPTAWLKKPPTPDAPAWSPRYTKNLAPLSGNSIPFSETGFAHHGTNALVALAAHFSEIADGHAIGLDAEGLPAVAAEQYDAFVAWLEQCEIHGVEIPDSWQTLEDIARDINVVLSGEGGLEAWVDAGDYGPNHVLVIPYRDGRDLRRLTFCSPQLARMIADRVTLERTRLERAIELSEKYGPSETDIMTAAEPVITEETIDPKEELRTKLQSLERFSLLQVIDPAWAYELIAASEHDAYAVVYPTEAGERHAYFATTEGLEYVRQYLAPAEYRTARQICESNGIPRYLFAEYASEFGTAGEFLSTDPCANTGLMPHYDPEQITQILRNYYDDVADAPTPITHVAAQTGQQPSVVRNYLDNHGVAINKGGLITKRAGLKYARQYEAVDVLDDTRTPMIFLMRSREVRNSDLDFPAIVTMCYDLAIPIEPRYNPSSRRTIPCVPTERLAGLQAAVQSYYDRYLRNAT